MPPNMQRRARSRKTAVEDANQSDEDSELEIVHDVSDLNQVDLREAPDCLLSNDAPDQMAVVRAMDNAYFANMNYGINSFSSQPPKTLNLSHLERLYRAKDEESAKNLLLERHRIEIDDRMKVALDGKQATLEVSGQFEDFVMLVADGPGFDILIPTIPRHLFSVEFTFSEYERLKFFNVKKGMTGACTDRCVMRMGSVDQLAIWTGMFPLGYLDRESWNEVHPVASKGSPVMEAADYRRVVMFFAHCLSSIKFQNIMVFEGREYPDPESSSACRDATNLWERRLQLTRAEVTAFSNSVKTLYDDWLRRAPPYFSNDFIRFRRPICIAARYGQNQDLNINDGNALAILNDWNVERGWDRVRYFNCASATHYRAKEVLEWRLIPPRELERENPDGIFSVPGGHEAHRIRDLARTPLRNRNREEIQVYGKDGKPINRYEPRYGEFPICGSLVHIPTAQRTMFWEGADNPEDDGDFSPMPERRVRCYGFPQAFTGHTGHIQANGVPVVFEKTMDGQNARLIRNRREQDPRPGGAGERGADRKVVEPVAYQMYNSCMHRLRTDTKYHEPQQGLFTQAWAGTQASGQRGVRNAKRAMKVVDDMMPHARFEEKIKGNGIPKDLRVEVVYFVRVQEMAPRQRTGKAIVSKVVFPLLQAFKDPDFVRVLKNAMVVLKPKVFPDLYSWTSYPVSASQEALHLWEKQATRQKASFRMIELMAIFDRVQNFCHTGNAAVLSTTIMNHLQVGHGRYPFIGMQDFPFPDWTELSQVARILPSMRSQLLTFGRQHVEAYMFNLKLEFVFHQFNHLGSTPYGKYKNNAFFARACICLHLMLDPLIEDIRNFVHDSVSAQIRQLRREDDALGAAEVRAREQEEALQLWDTCAEPLAFGGSKGHHYLLQCFPKENVSKLGFPRHQAVSLTDLARTLLAILNNKRRVSEAPLIANGACQRIFHHGMSTIVALGVKTTNVEVYVARVLMVVFAVRKIYFLPWHFPSEAQGGNNSKKADFRSWITFETPRDVIAGAALDASPDGNNSQMARIASETALARSEMANWSISKLSIDEFGGYITTKKIPPDSPPIHIDEKDVLTVETYAWAERNWDMTNPIHKLFLILAFIFCKACPTVGNVPGKESEEKDPTGSIRAAPWVDTKKQRGVYDKELMCHMMAVYMLALWDQNSPVRVAMVKHEMQDSWWSKHSSKCIKAFNLVRMGVCRAKTHRVWKAPRFDTDYVFLPDKDLKEYSKRLEGLLTNTVQYGPYICARTVMGEEMAYLLFKRAEFSLPQGISKPKAFRVHAVDPEEHGRTPTKRRATSDSVALGLINC